MEDNRIYQGASIFAANTIKEFIKKKSDENNKERWSKEIESNFKKVLSVLAGAIDTNLEDDDIMGENISKTIRETYIGNGSILNSDLSTYTEILINSDVKDYDKLHFMPYQNRNDMLFKAKDAEEARSILNTNLGIKNNSEYEAFKNKRGMNDGGIIVIPIIFIGHAVNLIVEFGGKEESFDEFKIKKIKLVDFSQYSRVFPKESSETHVKYPNMTGTFYDIFYGSGIGPLAEMCENITPRMQNRGKCIYFQVAGAIAAMKYETLVELNTAVRNNYDENKIYPSIFMDDVAGVFVKLAKDSPQIRFVFSSALGKKPEELTEEDVRKLVFYSEEEVKKYREGLEEAKKEGKLPYYYEESVRVDRSGKDWSNVKDSDPKIISATKARADKENIRIIDISRATNLDHGLYAFSEKDKYAKSRIEIEEEQNRRREEKRTMEEHNMSRTEREQKRKEQNKKDKESGKREGPGGI
jgi:hypothetical protein